MLRSISAPSHEELVPPSLRSPVQDLLDEVFCTPICGNEWFWGDICSIREKGVIICNMWAMWKVGCAFEVGGRSSVYDDDLGCVCVTS